MAKCRAEVSAGFPSVFQLVTIAAMLSKEQQLTERSLSLLAENALTLWHECSGHLAKKIEIPTRALTALRLRKNLNEIKIPIPKKYPVTFEDFLRLMIGGRSRTHRIDIYIEYAKEMVWRGHVSQIQYRKAPDQKYASAVMTKEEAEKLAKPASPVEIASVMDHANQTIYNANQQQIYQMVAHDFLQWLAQYKATILKKRGEAGAAGRKKKRKEIQNGQAKKT